MTNEQLVARIQAGEDVSENMSQLYDQVKDFIRSIAWKYRNSAELDDLEQEGYLAVSYTHLTDYELKIFAKVLHVNVEWLLEETEE